MGDAITSMHRNKEKGVAPCTLLVYGHDQGGQGPTESMASSLERLADPQGEAINVLDTDRLRLAVKSPLGEPENLSCLLFFHRCKQMHTISGRVSHV